MCVWSGCVYFVLPSFFVICFIYPAEKEEDVIENDITYHYHFSLLIYILMNLFMIKKKKHIVFGLILRRKTSV